MRDFFKVTLFVDDPIGGELINHDAVSPIWHPGINKEKLIIKLRDGGHLQSCRA